MMSTTTLRRKKSAATAVIAMSALMAGLAAADGALAQQVNRANRRAVAAQGPLINRVAIEGNRRVEKAQIEANLQVRARTPYNQATVDADVQGILEAYRRSGPGLAPAPPRPVPPPRRPLH